MRATSASSSHLRSSSASLVRSSAALALPSPRRSASSTLVAATNAVAGDVAGDQERWGPATQGLQLAISPVHKTWTVEDDPEFQVSFRNSGTDDLFLNLGLTLANGRSHHPVAVSLVLVEPGGHSLELKLKEPAYVAGRIDDYAVRVPTLAVHVLAFRLSEFYGPKLPKGRYRISARFRGRGATISNIGQDWTGWNFWQGTLESAVGEFEIRDSK
jgi:hypothetical protein